MRQRQVRSFPIRLSVTWSNKTSSSTCDVELSATYKLDKNWFQQWIFSQATPKSQEQIKELEHEFCPHSIGSPIHVLSRSMQFGSCVDSWTFPAERISNLPCTFCTTSDVIFCDGYLVHAPVIQMLNKVPGLNFGPLIVMFVDSSHSNEEQVRSTAYDLHCLNICMQSNLLFL